MIPLTLVACLEIGVKSFQKGRDENTPVPLQERNGQRYEKLKDAGVSAKRKLKEAKKKRSRRR